MNHSDSNRRSQARYPGVYKRGSGYSIVYRGVTGEQIWETAGPNEREAARIRQARIKAVNAERAIAKREKARGSYCQPTGETLEEFGQAWLERKRPRIKKSTYAGYECWLRREVFPRLGDKPLAELRPSDFDGLVADLETEGRPPGTIRNSMVPVRSMLSDAFRLGVPWQATRRHALTCPPRQTRAAKRSQPST